MHRFFVPPKAFASHPVVLTGDQAYQIRRVLRLRLGESVTLLDGQGHAYEAILIALGEAEAKFQVARRWLAEGEPRTHVTLCQAVLKGDHFAWALQKGVEVGISRFVPLVCERNVIDDLDAVEAKRERWERIIQEAAEQCGRGLLPELASAELFGSAVAVALPHPPPLRQGGGILPPAATDRHIFPPAAAGGIERGVPPPPTATDLRIFPPAAAGGMEGGALSWLRLIPWEGEQVTTLRDALAGCNLAAGARIELFIGPEGGFSDAEVAHARRYGIRPVTLGPRILRAETAGVVAAALIFHEAGDL